MTTIAYKNNILAYDSRVTANSLLLGSFVKGVMTKDYMVAAAGSCPDIAAFMDWLKAGGELKQKKDFGLIDKEITLDAIVVYKNGLIHHYDNSVYPFVIEAPFFALGSGGEIALGAMAAGCSAYRAIKIASTLDTATGGEVHVMAFKRKREKK